jgi:predicted lipase
MGHSLGGAIAQQVHFMIMQNYPNIILRTITIGSPRVFYSPWLQPWAWKRWKKLQKMSYNLYLFANKHDFIPKLPPAFIGLQHIIKPIILDDKSNFFAMFTVQNHIEKGYEKSLDRYFGITE